MQCLYWYLHNHSVGPFADVGEVGVARAHLEHLPPHDLRVRVAARSTSSFSHREQSTVTEHYKSTRKSQFLQLKCNKYPAADAATPISNKNPTIH